MSQRNVIEFLRALATRPGVLDRLKVRSKAEVIAAAAELGFAFSDAEFTQLIWDLEDYLASKRGEKFDDQFPLWQTMWGTTYLEFLVIDVIPSFEEADFVTIMTAGEETS